ncbi:hypothetical protein AOLI_G00160320 [Acnodon oligacanthus]
MAGKRREGIIKRRKSKRESSCGKEEKDGSEKRREKRASPQEREREREQDCAERERERERERGRVRGRDIVGAQRPAETDGASERVRHSCGIVLSGIRRECSRNIRAHTLDLDMSVFYRTTSSAEPNLHINSMRRCEARLQVV